MVRVWPSSTLLQLQRSFDASSHPTRVRILLGWRVARLAGLTLYGQIPHTREVLWDIMMMMMIIIIIMIIIISIISRPRGPDSSGCAAAPWWPR